MIKNFISILFLTGLVFFAAVPAGAMGRRPAKGAAAYESSTDVRVLILDNILGLTVAATGPFCVKIFYTDEIIDKADSLEESSVVPDYAGVNVGETQYPVFGIRIEGSPGTDILVNKRPYRGTISIIRQASMKLSVVNTVNVEEYLRGVLPLEMKASWDMEGLKAQAVAARSYALYRYSSSGKRDYDVTSDFFSQVYGGVNAEHGRTSEAVRETEGMLLTYHGKILPSYYHSTCGGHTEDAGEVWGEKGIRSLSGVRCGNCGASTTYEWQASIPLDELGRLLSVEYKKLGGITAVEVLERNGSGRVRSVRVATGNHAEVIPGFTFRRLAGVGVVKSTNFSAEVRGGVLNLSGRGFGHGVGMCQWGAQKMAQDGESAEVILRFYYPGAKLSRVRWEEP